MCSSDRIDRVEGLLQQSAGYKGNSKLHEPRGERSMQHVKFIVFFPGIHQLTAFSLLFLSFGACEFHKIGFDETVKVAVHYAAHI